MMVTNVRGEFSGVQGTVIYDPENPTGSSVDVVIDANMINTLEAARDTHLKITDFRMSRNTPLSPSRAARSHRMATAN
jgi:polyisoprenoid-binding protein YceI